MRKPLTSSFPSGHASSAFLAGSVALRPPPPPRSSLLVRARGRGRDEPGLREDPPRVRRRGRSGGRCGPRSRRETDLEAGQPESSRPRWGWLTHARPVVRRHIRLSLPLRPHRARARGRGTAGRRRLGSAVRALLAGASPRRRRRDRCVGRALQGHRVAGTPGRRRRPGPASRQVLRHPHPAVRRPPRRGTAHP